MAPPVPPRVRAGILGLLTGVAVASALGTALAPYLLVKSPLVLVALSPAAHHVALAAASVEPELLISVGTLRRGLTSLASYGLGYLYGVAALEWLEQRSARLGRLVRWLERMYQRFGVLLLVVAPVPTVAVLAGQARSRLVGFLGFTLLGLALWVSIAVFLGDALAQVTDLLTAFLGEYLLESTLVCVVVVALQQAVALLVRRRRQTGAAG